MSDEISMHYDGMNNLIAHMYTKWSEEQESAFRAALATAWDEGFEAGQDEADGHEAAWQWGGPHTCITNPYREETE